MTRREAEDRILDLLNEVRNVYQAFAPDDDYGVCTVVGKYSVSTFAFEHDEYGKSIVGKYMLNASEHNGKRYYF